MPPLASADQQQIREEQQRLECVILGEVRVLREARLQRRVDAARLAEAVIDSTAPGGGAC